MVLLVSCSKEDTVNQREGDSRIRISAELPMAMAATRGTITIGADHQLRCILEIWNKEEIPVLKYREEVLVEAGQTPFFDFLLKSGDYDCLLWADFIKKGATSQKITQADGYEYEHYEDTYYNTEDLKSVTIKDEYAANLFDTDNCDAFFSHQELEKQEEEILTLSFKMERPLAKLVVKEKEVKQLNKLKKLTVNYDIPQSFNVFAGEPIGKNMTATFKKEFDGDASQVLFTSYVFVPSEDEKDMNAIVLGLTTTATRNCEIPAGSIKLKRSQCTNAIGELIAGEGTVEPDGESPKVGDYFFNDGTWKANLTSEDAINCVGIVYATEIQAGDNVADYGESSSGKSILGYVISLKSLDAGGKELYMYNKTSSPAVFPTLPKKAEAGDGQEWNNDITTNNGYHKTQILLQHFITNSGAATDNYPALKCFYDWKGLSVVDHASDWYIPSAQQILVAVGRFQGFTPADLGASDNDFKSEVSSEIVSIPALQTALANAKTAGIADDVLPQSGTMLSSSLSNHKNGPAPIHIQVNKGKINRIKEGNGDSRVFTIRPILTILK